MHQTTVAKLEKADRPIRVGEVFVIADILGVSASSLIGTTSDAKRGLQIARLRSQLVVLEERRDFIMERKLQSEFELSSVLEEIAQLHEQLRRQTSVP